MKFENDKTRLAPGFLFYTVISGKHWVAPQ